MCYDYHHPLSTLSALFFFFYLYQCHPFKDMTTYLHPTPICWSNIPNLCEFSHYRGGLIETIRPLCNHIMHAKHCTVKNLRIKWPKHEATLLDFIYYTQKLNYHFKNIDKFKPTLMSTSWFFFICVLKSLSMNSQINKTSLQILHLILQLTSKSCL